MGYNPSYKWTNPTYPIYNWGYNPLTKWDEPPSKDFPAVAMLTPASAHFGQPAVSSHAEVLPQPKHEKGPVIKILHEGDAVHRGRA